MIGNPRASRQRRAAFRKYPPRHPPSHQLSAPVTGLTLSGWRGLHRCFLPQNPYKSSHVKATIDAVLQAVTLKSVCEDDPDSGYSGRLKCTCLAVSRKWLALGTSAGGLHLIQKEGWKQKLILTHKEGSITHVACCPHDEDFVAVATSQGLVVVWELQFERRGRPERVSVSWEHRGQNITALCWDSSTLRVFVGDSGGKVTSLRAGSSKLGKGSAFVIFPVQTVTTVDSRVVQLGYQDGRLLVSSLSRCYLADTEREKFWRVGNKERDGEYGACFYSHNKGLLGQSPLLYCARPGSRIWEANFNGEVLSTHQFKQLLACPPLPLITYREELRYNPELRTPQSLAFPKLLHFGDQNLLTWTDSAIYVFTPQNGQVLLWTEVKDLLDIAVYRGELFCLHGNGRLSQLSLLSADRCVERLLRRESWVLAATIVMLLAHGHHEQGQEVHSHRPPRTPEVSAQSQHTPGADWPAGGSHHKESFNVLDCGIYRVISRRGSQSDEETSSLMNQSMSEEERLKEFSFVPEEDQPDHDPQSSERSEVDRSEQSLPFHLPLSFRSKPPRIALQAVKDSVSSFVKKTTEKINTLQMNSELFQRPEFKESGQAEASAIVTSYSDEVENEVCDEISNKEANMQELWSASEQTFSEIQDPVVLLDPVLLAEALLEWLPVLERILGPSDFGSAAVSETNQDGVEQGRSSSLNILSEQGKPSETVTVESRESSELEETVHQCETLDFSEEILVCGNLPETLRVTPPVPIPSELLS
ncbi:hypothetical protein OJAV_G00054870 [Oryzias javanicus]|uniref:HPS5-like beta-propeller domain-containing protein n=1 Tax=Oryzias javanicus TaxID=123683 RepID=A0A437DAB6_ORYJA|nr:hypothetical protein OJAV_G00054870 [Oryzias javanicus]